MKFNRECSWPNCCFGDKFQRVTRKNTAGNTNVLTISAQYGLINQFEYYNNQYASEDTSGYTLLRKGEFAYNKSYSEGYPLGATKKLEHYESGVVSPLYICFAAKADVCVDFYSYYFESEPFYREIYKIAQEGARNHGLLNVPAEDFFQIKIADPPLAEQKRIAEILGCCDRGIALKKELIAEKKRQKKALMQKLLYPDSGYRLPGFTGEWRKYSVSEICTIESGGTPATTDEECWGGNVFWCTPSDITNAGKYIYTTPKTITRKGIENSSATLLPIGSIIMCSRASIGPRCITRVSMTTNQGFKNFICSKSLYNEFWYYFIDTILEDLYKMASGNTFKEISKSAIATYHVVIPPSYEEQQAIAGILSAADKEIDLLEQELAQQQQKKKSLMQLLLTGIARV